MLNTPYAERVKTARVMLASLVVAVLGIAPLVAGCGAASSGGSRGSASAPSNPNFPEVNDRLREACPGIPDAQIAALISGVEAAYAQGHAYDFEAAGAIEACSPLPSAADCATCAIAVLDQVYGR
jgi:hypothetical protein